MYVEVLLINNYFTFTYDIYYVLFCERLDIKGWKGLEQTI